MKTKTAKQIGKVFGTGLVALSFLSVGMTAVAQEYSTTSQTSTSTESMHVEWDGRWHKWQNDNDWDRDHDDEDKLRIDLRGSSEVPPVDTDMTGTAIFSLSDSAASTTVTTSSSMRAIDYKLNIENGDNITAAHIHCSVEGMNGPVIVTLYTSNQSGGTDLDNGFLAGEVIMDDEIGDYTATTTQGCSPEITNVTELMDAMEDGRVYVNVHTTQHPKGEIRGQIEGGFMMDDDMDMDEDEDNEREEIASLLRQFEEQLRQIQIRINDLLNRL